MTRISGKLRLVTWPYVMLAGTAGLLGWLALDLTGACIGFAGVAVIAVLFELYRGRTLFEAYHDGEVLLFTNHSTTLRTSWKNVRGVRASAPEGEGDWFLCFELIEPISGRRKVTVPGEGADDQARSAEQAARLLIEKFRSESIG